MVIISDGDDVEKAINHVIDEIISGDYDHGSDGQTSCGHGCCDGWGPKGTRPGDEMDCPCPGPLNVIGKRMVRGACKRCNHDGHTVFGCKATIIRGEW